MSHRPIARSHDLSRLVAEGYNIAIRHGYLLTFNIPYVNPQKEVAYGMLAAPLELCNDVTTPPQDHTILFAGECPYNQNGQVISAIMADSDQRILGEGLTTQHRFSAKPPSGKYADFYDKITTYTAILGGPALLIDPQVSHVGGVTLAEEAEDSVFKYIDTASPRVEITAVTAKLERRKVVIIGLGGTGGYLLDFVAKTPVEQIHLYDGDVFKQHNAFRAPGAASGEELSAAMKKVDYFAAIYSKMRRGIIPHPSPVDPSNIDELRDADIVFICIDDGPAKKLIIERLEEFEVTFIDAGMGILLENGVLVGNIRTTTSTPSARNHIRDNKRISLAQNDDDNDYDKNIQVADLNAFNAIMAVIKWKKLWGFYFDSEQEYNSVYAIDGNEIVNEDQA